VCVYVYIYIYIEFILFDIICVRSSTKDNAKLNSSNNTVSQSNGKQNNIGSQNGKASDSEEEKEQEGITCSNNEQEKRKKNKSRQREKQLLKKEARELRAKAMSKDLELFKFSSVHLSKSEDAAEVFQNGNLHDKSTNSKTPQKRNQTMEDNREPKRRKSTNSA